MEKNENDENKLDVREKTLEHGISYPSDEELIMLILGSGTKQMPIQKMARKIFDSMNESNSENMVEKLLSVKGIGQGKALAIAAALELGRRRCSHLRALITSPQDIIPFVKNYAMSGKEHFIMVTLTGGHEIIKIHLISVGTLSKTLIHPREVFKEAIKENSSAVILCHNHPSGNCTPSTADIESTKTLIEAAQIIGIPILDHIIFDCENYFSFLEHNVLLSEGESDDEEYEEDFSIDSVADTAFNI